MRDYNIESDLKQEKFEVIKLVQGDKGNKLTINVLEDGKPVSLTGCSITAKYKRADGQVINGSVTNISNNSFDAVIDSDITKVVGTLKMLFSIEKDDVKVSTFLLLADVREGLLENTGSSGGSTGGGEVTVDLSNYYKKNETYSKAQIDSQFKDIANQIEGGTATVPNNIVLVQDDNSTETTEDYIPLLSSNGTEYRLTINDNGVPVIKDSSNTIIFTCGTGSGGSSGGDTPTTPSEPGEVTSGTPYVFEWTEGKYIDQNNGKEVIGETSSVSQYISVVGMDYLKCKNTTKGYQSYNAFYDISKNFISNFSFRIGTTFIEIPNNASFMRTSVDTADIGKTIISPFTNPTQSWVNGSPYNLKLTADKYINTIGEILDYKGWSMTDYLECFNVNKLSITGNTTQTTYCIFLDQVKDVISTFTITTDNPCEISVPYGACYFVISNTTSAMNSITVTPTA